jgi:hypothetical protein
MTPIGRKPPGSLHTPITLHARHQRIIAFALRVEGSMRHDQILPLPSNPCHPFGPSVLDDSPRRCRFPPCRPPLRLTIACGVLPCTMTSRSSVSIA